RRAVPSPRANRPGRAPPRPGAAPPAPRPPRAPSSSPARKPPPPPPHCVIDSPGAEFVRGLRTHRFSTVWRKGYDPDFEAYAVTAQHPGFADFLKACGIKAVVVCGIATNICCFFAARDLRQAGIEVWIAEDASAGIDVP